jgi:hypothetical protein
MRLPADLKFQLEQCAKLYASRQQAVKQAGFEGMDSSRQFA